MPRVETEFVYVILILKDECPIWTFVYSEVQAAFACLEIYD